MSVLSRVSGVDWGHPAPMSAETRAAAIRLARASRIDWGQPVGDMPVDRYFGVVATPGPLCGAVDEMGEQHCRHTSCAHILWPLHWVTGMPRG